MITRDGNSITFSNTFLVDSISSANAALHQAVKAGFSEILLDFSNCVAAFPAPMLSLCSRAMKLRQHDIQFQIVMPKLHSLATHFVNANWAYLIDPDNFAQSKFRDSTLLPATHFIDGQEQRSVVDHIVGAVLGATRINRHGLASFEWALAEVTDNVLNHAQSSTGGLVQLSNYLRKSRRLEFIVVDSGVGIPFTLRHSKLGIVSDTEALDQAVKEGVTRDKEFGQGNGLFGTYQVCKKSKGTFYLQSGHARLMSSGHPGHKVEYQPVPFDGTILVAQIDYSDPLLLSTALQFGGKVHVPMDYVESHYEDWENPGVHFLLSSETSSFRSRRGGTPVRTKLANLLEMCPEGKIEVDFDGVSMISSSFADEAFAKLCLEIGEKDFVERIDFKNLLPLLRVLLNRSIAQRLSPS